jgi:hypothetical protein
VHLHYRLLMLLHHPQHLAVTGHRMVHHGRLLGRHSADRVDKDNG